MSRSVGVTELLRDVLPEWTTTLFTVFSVPGGPELIVSALGLLYVATVADAVRRPEVADGAQPLCSHRTAFVIAVVFGGLALTVLVKAAFSAPRTPSSLHAVHASEHGFPSGHVMAATVFWGAIALWSTVGRRHTRVVIAGVAISLVGLSRLALGVHYLVDVLTSVVFGVAYLVAVARLTREDPRRAFAVAIGIAAVSVPIADASAQSLLALAGTIGSASGWWFLERPPVRRRLVATTRRLQS